MAPLRLTSLRKYTHTHPITGICYASSCRCIFKEHKYTKVTATNSGLKAFQHNFSCLRAKHVGNADYTSLQNVWGCLTSYHLVCCQERFIEQGSRGLLKVWWFEGKKSIINRHKYTILFIFFSHFVFIKKVLNCSLCTPEGKKEGRLNILLL